MTAVTASLAAPLPWLPRPRPPHCRQRRDLCRGCRANAGPTTTLPPPPTGSWPEERPWAAVALSKALDTAGDVALIARRTLLPTYSSDLDSSVADGSLELRSRRRPVVLILGSGWAAHSLIKVVDTDTYEVLVVSPRNFFAFTPMLPSCAVGTVEFRSLLEPVRVANPCVTYLEAECTSLDTTRRVAVCSPVADLPTGGRPPFRVTYDVAVVAVGEQPATLGVPGVAENCYVLKEVTDAAALRRRIGEVFDLASLPGTAADVKDQLLHFLVVGGGATGVEFAATLAEFVRGDLAASYPPDLVKRARVTLLQSGDAILTQFDSTLADAALAALRRDGVTVRLRARVARVAPGVATLKDGSDIAFGLCLWSAGNSPRGLVTDLRTALQPAGVPIGGAPDDTQAEAIRGAARGKLLVDPWMRVLGASNVLALGDCATAATTARYAALPATAQVAGQQGAYAARLINRGFTIGTAGLDAPPPYRPLSWPLSALGGTTAAEVAPPFEFLSLGLLAGIGEDDALTQVDAGALQLRLSGRLASLLWRSVYVTKQVSFRNRVLILFDWLKTRAFGRDLSQF